MNLKSVCTAVHYWHMIYMTLLLSTNNETTISMCHSQSSKVLNIGNTDKPMALWQYKTINMKQVATNINIIWCLKNHLVRFSDSLILFILYIHVISTSFHSCSGLNTNKWSNTLAMLKLSSISSIHFVPVHKNNR